MLFLPKYNSLNSGSETPLNVTVGFLHRESVLKFVNGVKPSSVM